jgi:hypothetical protein
MDSLSRRAAMNAETYSDDEIRALARKAIGRLIMDVRSVRLAGNAELAESICRCICKSDIRQIRHLKWLLEQQELERPDLQPDPEKTN